MGAQCLLRRGIYGILGLIVEFHLPLVYSHCFRVLIWFQASLSSQEGCCELCLARAKHLAGATSACQLDWFVHWLALRCSRCVMWRTPDDLNFFNMTTRHSTYPSERVRICQYRVSSRRPPPIFLRRSVVCTSEQFLFPCQCCFENVYSYICSPSRLHCDCIFVLWLHRKYGLKATQQLN